MSFDVYGSPPKTDFDGSRAFQLAPNGVKQYCVEGSGRTCSKLTSAEFLYPYAVLDGYGGGSGGQPSDTCTPGANQVAVFTDPDYGGACVVKDMGDYANPSSIGLPNDSISSIKIGGGAKARLCRDDNFSNTCEEFTSDDPNLYNNSVNTDMVSSMQVTGGQPTYNCEPSETQVALFTDDNYGGLCVVKDIGDYPNPGAIMLPNDTITSLKVGARVRAVLYRNDNFDNTREEFYNNDPALYNNSVNTDTVSSVQVQSRGGIALYDNPNFDGEVKWFGPGKYNLVDWGFDNKTESVYYTSDYEGLYHLVLYSDNNQTGDLYHTDNSVSPLPWPFANRISSIEIYKHQPPGASVVSPVDNAKYPATTTAVDLVFEGGDAGRVHVWNESYNFEGDWQASKRQHLSGLTPGRYYWQAQGKNVAGLGPWTDVVSFTISTPPRLLDGTVTVEANSTLSVQVVALDDESDSLTLAAEHIPPFASFVDNHDGTATLMLAPTSSDIGRRTTDVQISDGSLGGKGSVVIDINPDPSAPPPSGFRADYYTDRDLLGQPTFIRYDETIDFVWGNGSPDPTAADTPMSARWTGPITVSEGDYVFTSATDGAARLYVDDQLLIDNWESPAAAAASAPVSLTGGEHTLRYEYRVEGATAAARLTWQPDSIQTNLHAGWHLVAGASGSNTSGNPLFGYSPSGYQSVAAGFLEAGRGYWVRYGITGPARLKTAVAPLTLHMVPGWNLIGNATGGSVAFPKGVVGFTFGTSGYVSRTTLEPGQGAWVKVSQGQDLMLGAGGMLSPIMTVAAPDGGESYVNGSTQTIRWSVDAPVSEGAFYGWVGDSSGNSISVLGPLAAIPGATAYEVPWSVHAPSGTDYRAVVYYRPSETSAWTAYDTSDGFFTVARGQPPAIAVTEPSGGTRYAQASHVPVTFSVAPKVATGAFTISACASDGTCDVLGSQAAAAGQGTYTYDWLVDQPRGQGYRIRASYEDDQGYLDGGAAESASFEVTYPDLVISTNPAESTDGLAHGAGNTYLIPLSAQYNNVTVKAGAYASAPAWNGSSGGRLMFSADGTVRVEGVITMAGKGYRGGPAVNGANSGYQGESYLGLGSKIYNSPNGGGGGGAYGADSGGGGGGYGSVGGVGLDIDGATMTDRNAVGGQIYGDAALSTLYLGSGGGSSGAQSACVGAKGGAGGGVISITAAQIIVTGSISANGEAGASVLNNPGNWRGGGGGSGGSIRLTAVGITGTSLVTANGGGGGYGAAADGRNLSGGAGGVGRIRFVYLVP